MVDNCYGESQMINHKVGLTSCRSLIKPEALEVPIGGYVGKENWLSFAQTIADCSGLGKEAEQHLAGKRRHFFRAFQYQLK